MATEERILVEMAEEIIARRDQAGLTLHVRDRMAAQANAIDTVLERLRSASPNREDTDPDTSDRGERPRPPFDVTIAGRVYTFDPALHGPDVRFCTGCNDCLVRSIPPERRWLLDASHPMTTQFEQLSGERLRLGEKVEVAEVTPAPSTEEREKRSQLEEHVRSFVDGLRATAAYIQEHEDAVDDEDNVRAVVCDEIANKLDSILARCLSQGDDPREERDG